MKSASIKKISLLFFIAVFVLYGFFLTLSGVERKISQTFSIDSITSELAFNVPQSTQAPTLHQQRTLLEALSKKYHYLSEGGQSFAFVSDDDRFVIKFFKQAQRRPPLLARLPLPTFLRRTALKKGQLRREKQVKEMQSYTIARDTLMEESALISAHLHKTSHLSRKLSAIDRKGKSHSIDLDHVEFLVQYKLTPVKGQIKTFMDYGQQELACRLIDNITNLLKVCYERGVYDDDMRMHKNIGCIGCEIFLLDLGRLRIENVSKEKLYAKLFKLNANFNSWLTSNYPPLAERHQQNLNTWLK